MFQCQWISKSSQEAAHFKPPKNPLSLSQFSSQPWTAWCHKRHPGCRKRRNNSWEGFIMEGWKKDFENQMGMAQKVKPRGPRFFVYFSFYEQGLLGYSFLSHNQFQAYLRGSQHLDYATRIPTTNGRNHFKTLNYAGWSSFRRLRVIMSSCLLRDSPENNLKATPKDLSHEPRRSFVLIQKSPKQKHAICINQTPPIPCLCQRSCGAEKMVRQRFMCCHS